MTIKRTDFPALADDLDSIFVETAGNAVAESVGMKLFNVIDDTKRTHDHQVLHGVAGVRRVVEGSDFPRVTSEEGDSITWTQSHYAALVPVTKQMRVFDEYDKIESLARTIVDDGFDKIDQSFADVLLNGWSTSYTDVYGESVSSVCPDGLALFSASHTTPLSADTFSNIISDGVNTNPALSRAAIVKTKANARSYTDPNGIHRPIKLDTVVVGPANEDLAHRLIDSDKIPGSGNNDTNSTIGGMKIMVWDRLDANSAGTDTSAYWFMIDSRRVGETLQSRFAQRPMLSPPDEVFANKDWEWSFDYLYSTGRGFPAYVYGSKGDDS